MATSGGGTDEVAVAVEPKWLVEWRKNCCFSLDMAAEVKAANVDVAEADMAEDDAAAAAEPIANTFWLVDGRLPLLLCPFEWRNADALEVPDWGYWRC